MVLQNINRALCRRLRGADNRDAELTMLHASHWRGFACALWIEKRAGVLRDGRLEGMRLHKIGDATENLEQATGTKYFIPVSYTHLTLPTN